ncbi:hypothetical protein ABMA27_014515 [Loxostege sticticalis]|uniref:C2H2-type domain-containing protein n=1 Tax=Loxostege sticticalis TaxID=481309 RepID=A0ABR3I969_LOXSC
MEYALKRSLLSRNKLAIILKGADGETQFCCVECPAKYSEKEQLELHLCLHNRQYRYLCGICGTGLKRKEHLDRHTLEHQEVRPHKCPDCGKAFKRKEHLNIHATIHKNDKTHECTLCNRSFHRKDHLQKHLQVHSKLFQSANLYPMSDQELEAELEVKQEVKQEVYDEDVQFNSEESYGDYEMQEMEDQDPLDNSECSDSLYSNTAMEPSVEIRTPDSGTNIRPFVCHICYKSYKRKDHLKIHSWTHMKKDKQCTGCGKAFHMNSQLAAHMHTCIQVHVKYQADQDSGSPPLDSEEFDPDQMILSDDSLLEVRRPKPEPEIRPHECVVCHRRFKRKQHLKVHANVHLKQEASIWCSLCNEGFLSNTQFEQHECKANSNPEVEDQQQQPLEAKKENKFPEEFLEMKMTEKSPDGPSFVMVQDEQNIPTPMRVFVCRYCQKPFKRRDHYKIHLNIHTGVRNFFCPDCGKGFYRKDHLQKHSQTHRNKPKPKKQLPELVPISLLARKQEPEPKAEVKPEITIHAPSNSKLRVPLQIKVPYQMVVSGRSVTVDPQRQRHEILT